MSKLLNDAARVPIETLRFSFRTLRILKRNGIGDLAQLMLLSEDELKRLSGIGRNATDEIISVREQAVKDIALGHALSAEESEQDAPAPSEDAAPESAAPAFDLPLEKLGLSVRSLGGLKRAGYQTLSEIMDLTEADLMRIHQLGTTSVKEILRVREEKTEALYSAPTEDAAPESAAPAFDLPLEKLGLSVRPFGALKRAGYQTLSEIMDLTEADLMRIQNLGRTSVDEILRVREEKARGLRAVVQTVSTEMKTQMEEVLSAAEQIAERLQLPQFVVERQLLDRLQMRSAVCAVLSEAPLKSAFESAMIAFLERSGDGAAFSEIVSEFGGAIPPDAVQTCLDRLSERGELRFDDGVYKRFYPSVSDFVASVTDERARSFLEQRLAGKTLEEVGTANDMTRERVRQICIKALSMRPRLYEDQYRAIYERYEWSREDFRLAFGGPDATFLYLQMAYRHGSSPIAQVLTDETIPAKLRRRAERAVYKNDVFIDGVRLHRDRQTLVRHAVRRYCAEQTRYEDFLEQYTQMLREYDLQDDPKLAITARTYESKLANCDYVLWIWPKMLRAYSVTEVDVEEFFRFIGIERYQNMTISTEILFRENPELMREYDIRDAYELHNLMRKLYPEDQTLIQFGRQPMITIGNGDLQSQLLDLLLQYAPITAEELAKKSREQFGILEQTALGTHFRCLDEYLHNGVYRIDADNLTPDRFAAMQSALTGDFYTIRTVRQIYRQQYPEASVADINPYTLKTLGFKVYSGYIIRAVWQSAASYFRQLIKSRDVLDLRPMDPQLWSITSFTQVLYELKSDYQIVEFEPQQFLSLSRLEQNGVTRADLEDYCRKVADFAAPDTFFTVMSLRNAGFRHPLDEIGFDDWFYSSLLIEDRTHFSYRRIGGTKLLYSGVRDVQLIDLLAGLVEEQPLEIYDLLELLKTDYGMAVQRDTLLRAVSDSELYYDPIMEKIYPDYDTYYEEI